MKCQKNATENSSEVAKSSPTLYHQMLSLKGKSGSGVRDTASDDTNASAVCLHTNCYTYSFSSWKQLDLYYKNHLTWIINSETSLCFEIPSSWSLASIKGTTWLSIQAPVFFRSERWSSPSSENWNKNPKGSLPIVSPVVLELLYTVNCNSSLFWKAITIPYAEDEQSICKRGRRLLGWLLDSSHQNLFLPEVSQETSETSMFKFIFFRKTFQMFLYSIALNKRLKKTPNPQKQQSTNPK